MTAAAATTDALVRTAAGLSLTGRVQGIGMRPAIVRFALQLSLAGYVSNTRGGVEVHVEGAARDVARFEQELRTHVPSAARLMSMQTARVEPMGLDTFRVQEMSLPTTIATSQRESTGSGALAAMVPPDVVTCDRCLAELQSETDRRSRYPFTSCADCGPRYSIIERMPYERPQTTMAAFPLCESCRLEFESPLDRRFHAQATACPRCGPQIWLRDASDHVVARSGDALRAAAGAILDGRIVALRGLGGYQLLVDATSPAAVERLRERKRRRGKPLAVMVASLHEATKLARLDETERRSLCHPAGPIVVAAVRGDPRLAPAVTGGLNTVGLMLPTTPLHWLLLDLAKRALVCTSANVESDPLVFQQQAAFDQLRDVADVWLEHDRPIRRPIDDSVVRVTAGRPVTVRLARGYAPLPLELGADQPLLALGGHQKAAVALSNGVQTVLGPHVGDLDTLAARQRFIDQVADLSDLYGVEDGRRVVDLHPEYFSTTWAQQHNRRVIHVQHHHAHIAAGMAEHGWLDRKVLGVSFDGTGYGADGTIWGGEFLLATAAGFERVGHLRPFTLPGGERAVREPWRVATALVREAAGEAAAARLAFETGDPQSLLPVLRSPSLSPTTTSAGRLFDGVAALVLGVERCQFEGQAAMLLESVADLSATGQYDMPVVRGRVQQIDWRPLVRQILQERAAGAAPGEMAMRFHRTLASAIVEICHDFISLPVVLGGGVFQNRVLVELLAQQFAEIDQPLGLPGLIPPNDGGLAAGQLAVAAALAQPRRESACV